MIFSITGISWPYLALRLIWDPNILICKIVKRGRGTVLKIRNACQKPFIKLWIWSIGFCRLTLALLLDVWLLTCFLRLPICLHGVKCLWWAPRLSNSIKMKVTQVTGETVRQILVHPESFCGNKWINPAKWMKFNRSDHTKPLVVVLWLRF